LPSEHAFNRQLFFSHRAGNQPTKGNKNLLLYKHKESHANIEVCSIELKIKFKLRDKMWPVELEMETNQLYLPK